MTIHFRQGKLEEHERQAILEAVYQQAKGAAKAAVKAVVEGLLEAEVTVKLETIQKRVLTNESFSVSPSALFPVCQNADRGTSITPYCFNPAPGFEWSLALLFSNGKMLQQVIGPFLLSSHPLPLHQMPREPLHSRRSRLREARLRIGRKVRPFRNNKGFGFECPFVGRKSEVDRR